MTISTSFKSVGGNPLRSQKLNVQVRCLVEDCHFPYKSIHIIRLLHASEPFIKSLEIELISVPYIARN